MSSLAPPTAAQGLFRLLRLAAAEKDFFDLVWLSLVSAVFGGPFLISAYLGFALDAAPYFDQMQGFVVMSLLLVLLTTLGLFAAFQARKVAARINSQSLYNNQLSVWSEALNSSGLAFAAVAPSEVISRINDTVETVQKHQLFVLQSLFTAIFVVLITIVLLSVYHPAFLMIVFVFVVLTCSVPIWIAKGASPYMAKEPERFARVSGFLSSLLRQQLTIRFTNMHGLSKQFTQILHDMSVNQAGKWLQWNFSFNCKVSLNLLSQLAILGLGGWLYLQQQIALADVIVVYVLTTMVMPRLDEIYTIYNYSQSLGVCYHTLDTLPKSNGDKELLNHFETVGKPHELRLDRVSFRYPASHEPVINDLSWHFRKGQKTLILGRSGSGKSTLVDLLCGMQSPTKGQIWVNQHKLETHHLPDLWSRLSLHDQSNLLLEQHSVKDNLSLLGQNVDQLRLQKACSVLNFEHCLNKPLSVLSGGERQRLCFIRSYIRPADIYIFDESGSALDAKLEQALLTLLEDISDSIVILVSHNRSLKPRFEQVLDLDTVLCG